MITNPIIPIWIMAIICVLVVFIRRKNKYSFIRQIIICILLFLINLRFMIPNGEVMIRGNNLDVLFVIDNTISMIAEDYGKNEQRITAVKRDAEYIMEELAGAKFSVITFSNSSQILMPFSKDANMARDSISTISVMDELYAKGSSLNIAKDDILKMLKKSEAKDRKEKDSIFYK